MIGKIISGIFFPLREMKMEEERIEAEKQRVNLVAYVLNFLF